MKKISSLLIAALTLIACNKSFDKTDSGVEYKILAHEEGSRAVSAKDMLLMQLRMSVESSDSLLMETFADNTPRYIPAEEPTLKEVLQLLAKGDSAEFLVNADTLFRNSFGMNKPAHFSETERVRFVVKVVDVFTQAELEMKSRAQMESIKQKDSVDLAAYVSKLQNVKTTASGLMYVVEKEGNGKQPKKGERVAMIYSGYFTSGQTFDENIDREKPFEFNVGLMEVIPGWDEAVQLMKVGGKYKLIVPWQLAYGERGTGPIMPYTSLVFDVELLNVK
jgi:FKBP-type peptidyl-prolyl cis-trans isomerase FkpA